MDQPLGSHHGLTVGAFVEDVSQQAAAGASDAYKRSSFDWTAYRAAACILHSSVILDTRRRDSSTAHEVGTADVLLVYLYIPDCASLAYCPSAQHAKLFEDPMSKQT